MGTPDPWACWPTAAPDVKTSLPASSTGPALLSSCQRALEPTPRYLDLSCCSGSTVHAPVLRLLPCSSS